MIDKSWKEGRRKEEVGGRGGPISPEGGGGRRREGNEYMIYPECEGV